MISQEEFLKIFQKEKGFSQDELIRFYRSIERTVILSYAGKYGLSLLLKLCLKDQWPVLKRIDESSLGIYKGADVELLDAFIQTIRRQKEKNTWITLERSVYERAGLYELIFDFSPAEVERCIKLGKKFEKLAIQKAKRCKIVFGALGAGAAVAGAVGAGVLLWKKK